MANKVFILLLGFVLFSFHPAKAAVEVKDTIPLVKVDDEITLFDPLDTLTNSLFKACYKYNKPKPNKYGFDTSYVPIYPDEVIMKNMAHIPSAIPLVYNQWVKAFLNMYSVRKRSQVKRMLGLTEMYFPIFEQELDRRKMPVELKYLPIIESALNPNAVSKAGATGLWQLMYNTGKFLSMDIHSYVDERRDPYRSTEAAVQYLNQLYGIYNDWLLVIAAYNCGPGNVNKAIKRSGGKTNFWELKPYLPKETQGYVPAFIAAMYVIHYYEDFNFQPEPCGFSFNVTDTVLVKEAMSLDQISKGIGMDINELVYLNPSLTKHYIPATENGFPLRLPGTKAALFVSKKDSILKNMVSAEDLVRINSANSESAGNDVMVRTTSTKKTHTVKKGENIFSVAQKYDVSPAQIKKWNGLKSNSLKSGQKLKIVMVTQKAIPKERHTASAKTAVSKEPVEEEDNSSNTDDNETSNTTPPPAPVVKGSTVTPRGSDLTVIGYTVKPGDTFMAVCRLYNCNPQDLKNWNGLTDLNLRVGQKLNIYIDSKDVEKYTKGGTANVKEESNVREEEEAVTPPPAATQPTKRSTQRTTYYTVKSGDTLWEISRKYNGVTVDQIKRANSIGTGKGLKVGMKLKIPM